MWGDAALVILGGALGFSGSFFVSRYERKQVSREQKRRILARYQAQAAIVVARLRELPPAAPVGPVGRAIDHLRGEQATWLATQRGMIRALGEHWRDPIEALMATGAELRLLDPSDQTLHTIDDVEDYVLRLSTDRTDALRAEWSGLHQSLELAVRAEADR